ncbi:MAG: trypsin-like peptidase domain-containing protein [Pseudomonadota bacterium]
MNKFGLFLLDLSTPRPRVLALGRSGILKNMVQILFGTTFLALAFNATGFAQETPRWSKTLESISSSVVSIRIDGTRAFDTEASLSSQATGFVVDAERGLILTNRHVVMPGPVVAEAVFLNREEVALKPVYRDPVHDFGFFRYDPEELRFLKPKELKLVPENAHVGREIRVVGNDAGEQLSILAGTIARLDRQAPSYGRGKYNDFNTFYFQAASGTSGGSSGSPVIDIKGNVVALNAGANTSAASSFFLPLDRIERALDLIREDEAVSRGTLQTVFVYRPFDELTRLGLTQETEALVRESFGESHTGMLVVSQVVPGGPGAEGLEPGDILIRVNGELVTQFVPLEAIMDGFVGQTIDVELERGGINKQLKLPVQDLHDVTPDEFLEFGNAVFHQLSYQQARHFNMPVQGVYVAKPGYVLGSIAVPRGAVMTSIDGKAVDNLEDLARVIENLADRQPAALRFFTFEDPSNEILRVMRMDWKWFRAQHCKRDDELGLWPCESLQGPEKGLAKEPASTRFYGNGDARAKALAASLVMVNFDMPYPLSGVSDQYYHGTGLVVDAKRGLVVVDRNTVPIALGDVSITFASTLEVPGRVEFVHPQHNMAIVSYDPALIGDTPVQTAKFSREALRPGNPVWVVGLQGDHSLVSQGTEVASIDPLLLPLSRTFRFRDSNLEVVSLVNAPENMDGVLADRKGNVKALWSSFAYQGGRDSGQLVRGVPIELVQEMVNAVQTSRPLYSLETEFSLTPLSNVRNLGLPADWIKRLESHNLERRRALQVVRVTGTAPVAEFLRAGDLLLAINGKVVNSFREVERAVQAPTVDVTFWRNGNVETKTIPTVVLDGSGVNRMLAWAGALLQQPYRDMAAQRGIPNEGVYVAYFGFGSPANRYGLWAGRRIVEVDGKATPDLDGFLAAVAQKTDRESVRLKTVTWNNATEVITLKLDNHYWPTYEMRLSDEGWSRVDH